MEKTLKICEKGHKFYKSTDCPTCPTCDKVNKPEYGFLSRLSSPARNSLIHHGIDTLEKLSQYSEKEILKLHGMGPASLPTLGQCLSEEGLSFRS